MYVLHTYIHAYIHTHLHTYIRIYVYTYVHTYIHIHTYIHTYIYIHICGWISVSFRDTCVNAVLNTSLLARITLLYTCSINLKKRERETTRGTRDLSKKKNWSMKNSWISSEKKTARRKSCIQECILAHASGPAHVSLSAGPAAGPIYLSLSLSLFLSLTALRFFMHDFFFLKKNLQQRQTCLWSLHPRDSSK